MTLFTLAMMVPLFDDDVGAAGRRRASGVQLLLRGPGHRAGRVFLDHRPELLERLPLPAQLLEGEALLEPGLGDLVAVREGADQGVPGIDRQLVAAGLVVA